MKDCRKEDYRNAFLNLAAPFYQSSEPGDLAKTKLVEGLEVTLWDTWTVNGKGLSLQKVIEAVEAKYAGLEVRDVMHGNKPLYFSAIMNAAGKEKEREAVLKQTVCELIEVTEDDVASGAVDQYVDLAITCVAKGDKEASILEGVPPLRVILK